TFYIISSRVGQSGSLSLSDLQAIQAAGHEIGGHTVDHPDLTTLNTSQQQQEICNDRTTLIGWGFNPISFAYPFGSYNTSAETVAKNCGYLSARIVGGLDCPGSGGCANTYAETIPPANPFTVQTPDSIKSTTSLAQIEQYVMNA